uniref:VCBS domain-containing protein n=1 Tax=Polynucleobacter sp. TaxID=2029855 RepID=UPI004048BC5C
MSGSLKLKDTVTADKEAKGSYSVTVTATDTASGSSSSSFTITVGDVNDAPVLAAPVSMAITEDASSSAVSGALSATDPEGATLSYQLVNGTLASGSYTLTGTYGTLVLNGATGSYTYTLNNSAQATNALAGGASASESFGVRVSDGSSTTASQNLVINITGANDAPVIGSGRTATVAENTATSTVLYAPDVSDVDTGDTKTYALSGPDASYFNINAKTGAVTLKSAANYEVKASYQFIVSVTDSAGAIDIQGVTLSVTNVAEAYSGTIVDGYVAGATIFQDLNNNNALDSGEPNAVTNAVGQFSLAGVVSSANAPIKMITGFDIGTNAPIVTTLGAPSGVVGAAIASPLSTITSLASANQPDVSLDNVVARLGSYVGLSGSTLQTLSLLTDDPIAKLLSTNSGEAAAAKELFAANQLMMSMSHITGAVTKYIAEQVDSDIQTYLSSQGVNNVDALGSLDAYEKVGTDAVFSQVAQAIAAPTVASENVFQLKSNFVSLIDYNPATGETATHRIGLSTDANVATIAFNNGALNQQNLANAVNNSGSYQSPYINVELQKIASGSGSTSVTVKLVDGADGTRSGGEREVGITANLTWASDGNSATFTLPTQSLSGYYYDTSGNRYDLSLENVDSDLLSLSASGVDVPASLNIKLQSMLAKLSAISPGSLLGAGEFHLSVSSSLPLVDAHGANIDSFAVPIEISSTPAVTVFAADATVQEADVSKTVTLYLSEARDTDVTVNYHLGGGTATSGNDYTATSGTLTIAAGLTSGSISLPILADSAAEGNETVRVIIDSVSGATAMNGYATVTIVDAPTADSLYTNLVGTALESAVVESAYQDLAGAIQSKLASTNVTIGGQAQSLSSALSGHIDVSAKVTQYEALGNALTQAIWSKLQTVFTAADGQAGEAYGQSLMVANAAAKALDLSQVVGQIMSSAGAYLTGKSVTDLNALIDSYVALASDTVGDIFGVDTATYFSGATVAMLTRGNDTETLSDNSEIVAGLGGNDTVNTAGGNDKYIGGSGVDTVRGGAGNDHLYGYGGNDLLYGDAGNDKLNGGKGDDQLDGGLGDDELLGGAGNDTIVGGGGSDTITAGTGDDVITVGGNGGAAFTTVVNGGAGTDRLNI